MWALSGSFHVGQGLVRHLKKVHKFPRTLRCNTCHTFFGSEESWKGHCRSQHSVLPGVELAQSSKSGAEQFELEREKKAVNGHFQSYRLKIVGDQVFDPVEFLVTNEMAIRDFITHSWAEIVTAMVGLCIEVKFTKLLLKESAISFFHSPLESLTTCFTSDDYFAHVDKLFTTINVFCTAGSGWVIDRLNTVELKLSKYFPLRAGSFIRTPTILENQRKSLLNIKNLRDNLCFIYSIFSFLFPVRQNQERPQSYKNISSFLIYNPRKMPMALSDIPNFERDSHLKTNVYALEKRKKFPVYLSKYTGVARRNHLLLLSYKNNWHYCLSKNLDRVLKILLRTTNTANYENNQRKFCKVCLQSVARDKFSHHKSLCSSLQPQIVEMAAKGTTLTFKNWHKTFKCPFVVYADLEAFDVKTEDFDLAAEQMRSGLNSGGPSTTIIENQYPCSFGVVLVDVHLGHVEIEKFYRGDDCIAVLMNTLRSWVRWADTERQPY